MAHAQAVRKSLTLKDAQTSLGVVYGFAVVSKENGQEYFDLQGDHIPEDVIAKAALDVGGLIDAKVQHAGETVGKVVFSMPVYSEGDLVTKSGKTGLYVGIKFPDEVLEKFEKGELTGFSIGGQVLTSEEVD